MRSNPKTQKNRIEGKKKKNLKIIIEQTNRALDLGKGENTFFAKFRNFG